MPKITLKPETVEAAAESLTKYIKDHFDAATGNRADALMTRARALTALDDLRILRLAARSKHTKVKHE